MVERKNVAENTRFLMSEIGVVILTKGIYVDQSRDLVDNKDYTKLHS